MRLSGLERNIASRPINGFRFGRIVCRLDQVAAQRNCQLQVVYG
jgi:hypothetical protein